MNLNTRKARAPIAVLGVTALCATGLGAFATSASAAGETLAFGPTGTSATIVNVVPGSTSVTAGLTYGVKATGSSGSGPLHLGVISAPTGASLYAQRVASNGLPTADASATGLANATAQAIKATGTAGSSAVTLTAASGNNYPTVSDLAGHLIRIGNSAPYRYATVSTGGTNATSITLDAPLSADISAVSTADLGLASANNFYIPVAASSAAPVPGWASGDNMYFGATVPGTYTFRLFKDSNGNAIYEAGQDDSTPTFTLTVKDVTASTVSTADDLSFGLTAPTSVDLGQSITASATMGGLTTVDTRGLNASSLGKLGVNIASATKFDGTATGVTVGVDASPTFDGTAFAYDFTTSGAAGSLDVQPIFDQDGSGTFSSDYSPTGQKKTTTVASNGVSAFATSPDVTAVTGTVKRASANTATIKPGTASATYTATVTDAGTKTDDIVYFTLTPGTNTPGLSGDGTLVSSSGGVKVYSVTADADGDASITVTSSDTTNGTTYTVGAKSNAVTATNNTATYQTAAATSFTLTNTASELTPTVPSTGTGSVTIKGKLLDQYGAGFQPTSPASNPALIDVDESDSSWDAGTGTQLAATIGTDGTFSSAWTRTVVATAGEVDSVKFTRGAVTLTSNSAITWASTTAPGSVTLTTPNSPATSVNLSDSGTLDPGQSAAAGAFGSAQSEVTGTVKDSGGTALAYKSVTVTGSAGVYFSTANTGDDLATSATVVSNSSGNFSGVFAYFTKSGSATITATAGTAVKTATLTTDVSDDPYKVTVNDVSGKPGSTLIVTGTIKDAFGNNVPNEDADLSLGTSTLGAFSDSTPTTNSLGVFSTTFTSGSNSSGTATITATLDGMTENPTADEDWTDVAGITVPHGEYMDQATLTLTDTPTTISATGSIIGGGTAELSGTAEAGASVEVWAKPQGASSFSLVSNETADSSGEWGTSTSIVKTTSFFAKSNNKPSSTVSTVVFSTQTLKAKALGGGKVQFTVYGTPNVRGFVNIYSGDVRLAHVKTNNAGDVTTVVQSKAGRRTFKVYFVAPGTSLKGSSLTGTVK